MNRPRNLPSTRIQPWWIVTSLLATLSITGGCTEQPSAPNGVPTSRPAFLDQLAGMKTESSPLPPGENLPNLLAEGWLHGDPPSPAGLLGQVVVIEIWAHW